MAEEIAEELIRGGLVTDPITTHLEVFALNLLQPCALEPPRAKPIEPICLLDSVERAEYSMETLAGVDGTGGRLTQVIQIRVDNVTQDGVKGRFDCGPDEQA